LDFTTFGEFLTYTREIIATKKDSSALCYFVGIEGAMGTVFADGCRFMNAEL